MKNTFSILSSAALLTGANILTTFITLASGLYIARQLDVHQYGQYAYMMNLFLLCSLFLGFGLTGQISKDMAEQRKVAVSIQRDYVRPLLALRLTLSLLTIGVAAVLNILSGDLAYFYAGAGAALMMYTDFCLGALSGLQHIKEVGLIILSQPATFFGLIILVPVTNILTLYNLFLLSQLFSALVALVACMLHPGLRAKPGISAIKNLNLKGMVAGQIYLVVLLQTAYGAYGVTLLGALNNYETAGELSIAFTVIRLLPLFSGSLVNSLYYPRLCAIYKNFSDSDNNQRFKNTAKLVYQIGVAVGAGCAALLIVYSDTIIVLLYTLNHSKAIILLEALAVMTFFSVTDQILTWTLIAYNQSRKALQPLILRMLLLLLTLPLEFTFNSENLGLLIILAYLISSILAWFLQISSTGLTSLVQAVWDFLGLFTAAVLIAELTRYAGWWPITGPFGLANLSLAGLIYSGLGLGLLWAPINRQVLLSQEL